MPDPCRRLLAAVLLVLMSAEATGCTSWRTVDQPSPEAIRPGRSDHRIRFSLSDGTRIVADSIGVRPDSVVAYSAAFTHFIPRAMIRKVEVRRFDALKTVPTVLVGGFIISAFACSQVCDFGYGGGGGGCSYFCGTSSVAPPPEDR
jgi:hypothetical protein